MCGAGVAFGVIVLRGRSKCPDSRVQALCSTDPCGGRPRVSVPGALVQHCFVQGQSLLWAPLRAAVLGGSAESRPSCTLCPSYHPSASPTVSGTLLRFFFPLLFLSSPPQLFPCQYLGLNNQFSSLQQNKTNALSIHHPYLSSPFPSQTFIKPSSTLVQPPFPPNMATLFTGTQLELSPTFLLYPLVLVCTAETMCSNKQVPCSDGFTHLACCLPSASSLRAILQLFENSIVFCLRAFSTFFPTFSLPPYKLVLTLWVSA